MAGATSTRTPWWTWTWPTLPLIVLGIQVILLPHVPMIIPEIFVLVATVFAAVYHAEVVAQRSWLLPSENIVYVSRFPRP